MTFNQAIVLALCTGIVGFLSAAFAAYLSDHRKKDIEKQKELRSAYARWHSTRKMVFLKFLVLVESTKISLETSDDKDILCAVSTDELNKLEPLISLMSQNTAEITLLERDLRCISTVTEIEEGLTNIYRTMLNIGEMERSTKQKDEFWNRIFSVDGGNEKDEENEAITARDEWQLERHRRFLHMKETLVPQYEGIIETLQRLYEKLGTFLETIRVKF